jgi:K+ transporter
MASAIKNNDGIIEVLSLIIYSIISIALIKYILIVMAANDNGMVSHMRLFEIELNINWIVENLYLVYKIFVRLQ